MFLIFSILLRFVLKQIQVGTTLFCNLHASSVGTTISGIGVFGSLRHLKCAVFNKNIKIRMLKHYIIDFHNVHEDLLQLLNINNTVKKQEIHKYSL